MILAPKRSPPKMDTMKCPEKQDLFKSHAGTTAHLRLHVCDKCIPK